MLTLQKAHNVTIRVDTVVQGIETLLTKEWLLTNGRGGYASSTIAGCNTRRYHGLLIGSLQPPVNRILALSNCLEMVISGEETFNLSTFEFSDAFAPKGFEFLKGFHRDIGVHFNYVFPGVEVARSIYLPRQTDTVAIVYDFTHVQEPVEFITRPFVSLRNFHGLMESHTPLRAAWLGSTEYGLEVRHDMPKGCSLLLGCPSAHYENDPQWWFNFTYRVEKERGQDFTEDLWTPGFFKCRIDSPTKVVLWAQLNALGAGGQKSFQDGDIEKICRDLHNYQKNLRHEANQALKDESQKTGTANYFDMFCLAADQFVTKRQTHHGFSTTILAGYPWFADWGRDAFISLPGLLLGTGRFEQAKSVLTTFATAEDQGMIPNCFDDYSDTAHFNSVDASLWFINAAFQYFSATGDSKTFTQELIPTIRRIIESYQNGTRYGIRADADELITAGDEDTQLTWMDAKCDGIAFTPRYGKAVEVNALWYNALCLLAEFYTDQNEKDAAHYRAIADRIQTGFGELFWNESKGYLNDYILPNGSADDRLRPNQIFAVSLKFSPLPTDQQKSVVAIVQERLLTPYGLRTLDPGEPDYKGEYTGPMRQRDEAYHQGTVWPYLIGPFVEAYLKVNGFTQTSKNQAAEFLQPLLKHLTEDACLGSVSEIFDGDSPHKPKGCFAQAWSVAELIRAYHLINSP